MVSGAAQDDVFRFCDRLRADPALVRRYSALKRSFDNQPMDAYRTAKDAFVSEVLAGGNPDSA